MGIHVLKIKTYIGTPRFKITMQWLGPLQKNFLPFFKSAENRKKERKLFLQQTGCLNESGLKKNR